MHAQFLLSGLNQLVTRQQFYLRDEILQLFLASDRLLNQCLLVRQVRRQHAHCREPSARQKVQVAEKFWLSHAWLDDVDSHD